MSAQPSRRPWPIKWIVVAILLMVVPYTFIRWHYRKPGPAFAPYQDIRDRANTSRLLSAGFQRVTLAADRPTEPLRNLTPGEIQPALGGLPASLDTTLVDKPLLAVDITSARAAAHANPMLAYPIEFTCSLPDEKQQLGGARLYLRDDEAIIVPEYERLDGALLARSRQNLVRLTIPPGILKPGQYRVTLVGSRSSKTWMLEVR